MVGNIERSRPTSDSRVVRWDGSCLTTSRFENRAGSVVYTVGQRDPQGLAWAPDGSRYEAEFGQDTQDTQDEINLLRLGNDYRWPTDVGQGVGSRSQPVR